MLGRGVDATLRAYGGDPAQGFAAADEGMVALTLEVRESNRAARRLYEGFGMQTVGRRVAYYSDTGEDALILTVALDPAAGLPSR